MNNIAGRLFLDVNSRWFGKRSCGTPNGRCKLSGVPGEAVVEHLSADVSSLVFREKVLRYT
jgi:hypothetical protein